MHLHFNWIRMFFGEWPFTLTHEDGTLISGTGTYVPRVGNCATTQEPAACNVTFRITDVD